MSYSEQAQSNIKLVAAALAKNGTAPVDLAIVCAAVVAQAQATLAMSEQLAALRRVVARQGQADE